MIIIGKKIVTIIMNTVNKELITSPGVAKVNALKFIRQHIKAKPKLSLTTVIVEFQYNVFHKRREAF